MDNLKGVHFRTLLFRQRTVWGQNWPVNGRLSSIYQTLGWECSMAFLLQLNLNGFATR